MFVHNKARNCGELPMFGIVVRPGLFAKTVKDVFRVDEDHRERSYDLDSSIIVSNLNNPPLDSGNSSRVALQSIEYDHQVFPNCKTLVMQCQSVPDSKRSTMRFCFCCFFFVYQMI